MPSREVTVCIASSRSRVRAGSVSRTRPGGRGDSGALDPFAHETALQREIEDIAALIEAAGSRASLVGWSSGGELTLRSAGAGIGVDRVAVHEVPFMVDPHRKTPMPDYGERLDQMVAAGDRSGAVRHFLRNAIGIPAPFVALMRLMPIWKSLKTTGLALPYDGRAR